MVSFIALLFLLAFSPYHALMRSSHVADDASYLAHGFTLGLDFNLQYDDMVAQWKTPKGIAAHPIGPGILAAPFIATFSIVDRMMHHEVIENHHAYQYSWSFYGFVFASVFFFLIGLHLYAKGLECLNIPINRFHFLYLASSFGVLFYVLYRPVMGHSFEFFSIALCFWASCRFLKARNNKKTDYSAISLSVLGMILTLAIRPANINILLLPVIIYVFCVSTGLIQKLTAIQTTKFLTSLVGLSLLFYLPLACLNIYLYDMAFPSSEVMYGPNVNPVPKLNTWQDGVSALMILLSRLPQIKIICFSSEFGLALTSTILFVGTLLTIYFVTSKNLKKPFRYFWNISLIGGYLGLPIVITLFWQSTGDAYGYRFMFCYFPIALLGYAFWKNELLKKYGSFSHYPLLQKGTQTFILVLCGFGILGNMFIGLNEGLMYNTHLNAYQKPNVGGAVGYNIAVVKAIPKVSTWLNLTATRTPGFLAIGLLDLLKIDPQQLKLPGALAQNAEKFRAQYVHPPLRVYIQVLLLGLLFIGGCLLFLKNSLKRAQ